MQKYRKTTDVHGDTIAVHIELSDPRLITIQINEAGVLAAVMLTKEQAEDFMRCLAREIKDINA